MYHINDSLDPLDKSEFKKDFKLILNIFSSLQDHAKHYDERTQDEVALFREGLSFFDKKYPDLDIKLEKERPSFRYFKIYFKSESVLNLYKEVIPKMKPLGMARNLIELQERMFVKDTHHIKTSLAALFPAHKTIMLRAVDGKVSLVYNYEELLNGESPSFELCMYIALRKGIDRSIKVIFPEKLKVLGKHIKSKSGSPKGAWFGH